MLINETGFVLAKHVYIYIICFFFMSVLAKIVNMEWGT